jgi:hypothetical protein
MAHFDVRAVPATVAARHDHLSSADVLRFLGRRIPLTGDGPPQFSGQVLSDLQARQEGVRIKHRLNSNSVKLYDKAFTSYGSVLRAETTIHNTDDILVYRPKEGGPQTDLAWRVLRSGIADLHRRAEVSRRAAERYLDALASVEQDTTLEQVLQLLCCCSTALANTSSGMAGVSAHSNPSPLTTDT